MATYIRHVIFIFNRNCTKLESVSLLQQDIKLAWPNYFPARYSNTTNDTVSFIPFKSDLQVHVQRLVHVYEHHVLLR